MIKAHDNNYAAQQFGTSEWRESTIEHMPWSSCSYCGSMHPQAVIDALKNGGKLTGSDWKYGWPHKFYIEVLNPEPDKLFRVSSTNFKQEGPGWVQISAKEWIQLGRRLIFHGKWYNVHFSDDDVPAELSEVIAEHSRIRFRIHDGRMQYVAPWHGFQMHGLVDPVPPIPYFNDQA